MTADDPRRRDRRPSPRSMAVNLGEVWAWVLLWSFLAFLPTGFGYLGQSTFAACLACTVGLGLSLSLNGWLTRRRRRNHPRTTGTPPP